MARRAVPIPRNLIGGHWLTGSGDASPIHNPATEEVLAEVRLSTAADVASAVAAASDAFPDWRRTPAEERIQVLFRLKQALEERLDELAELVTLENGKTLAESRAEIRRGIENVEVACGIPTLMQGYNLEDVARGVDETMIRQPLGVVAAITPFNFPLMIPLWFLPYAVACGNTLVLKPSERVPLAITRLAEILIGVGLPPGVLNLVHGGPEAVDALLDHPEVQAISFVGSTPVARHVYARGSANGKRVQCQGGAKNHSLILPDADLDMAAQIVSDSAFGCAGQRCLAISVAVTVGEAHDPFRDGLSDLAASLKVGFGADEGVHMGPVISERSQTRVRGMIDRSVADGARPILDGRSWDDRGYFLRPTVLEDVPPNSDISRQEVFGPVLSLIRASTIDDAIEIVSKSPYGNAASIFTSSGAAARKFRYETSVGNIGVNLGVAAPMAYFPFSGWKDSFMGVLHGQGRDAVEFYTEKKVVIERWPKEWTRKF